MKPEQGEIVLVPVPFSDLSSQKRRPVIVISNNEYHRQTLDFLAVALSSQHQPSAYGFIISIDDLADGHLNRPSQVRVDKTYTLAQSIVTKRFGRVADAVLDRIRLLHQELLSFKP